MILRHTFTPHDNNRLSHVCGPADAHLRTIEIALGVKIAHRHEQFKIDGPKAKANDALELLQALYEMADDPILDDSLQLMLAGDTELIEQPQDAIQLSTRRPDLRARTANQSAYLENIARHDITFGIGPAGTGKTYLAVAHAASLLERGDINRIILSRPAVEAGERLGFLPGDMKDKVDPYLRPLYDALYDMMKPENVERCITSGIIEVAPLAFMRGRTLSNAVVILDEAQNTTSMQMKMFLTRLGENSKMIVTGDPTQVDLPRGEKSGLVEAVGLLDGVEGVHISRFNDKDVVRHALVGRIVRAYEADTARRLARKDGDTEGLARTLGTVPRS